MRFFYRHPRIYCMYFECLMAFLTILLASFLVVTSKPLAVRAGIDGFRAIFGKMPVFATVVACL